MLVADAPVRLHPLPRTVPVPTPPVSKLDTPHLSVVIVNYRQWDNTARLTGQLRHSEALRRGLAEVIIVDNQSVVHPWRTKMRRQSGVSLRCLGRNRGFARGVNEGCRLSRGEWFLLLNPDVTVPERFLDRVIVLADEIQKQDPTAGVIGFRLENPDGSAQGSVGKYPTLWRTLFGLLQPRSRRKCQPLFTPKRLQVPWLTGCCLLIRRECLQQLGGFDPGFFLYYEDVDFCQRAWQNRWSVWYEPQLHVTHHHPLHSRQVPPHIRLMTRQALLSYARKHWPAWQLRAITGLIWTEAKVRQWWASRLGQRQAVPVFAQLEEVARAFWQDEAAQAFRRVWRVAQAHGRAERGKVHVHAKLLPR
jgi:GT2 family glycosyltransferase